MIQTLSAFAKVNLTLDIVGRRADGYHLLSMVMQSVSLCDTLTIRENGTGISDLSCSEPGIPCNERNLILKAATAFFAATKLQDPGLSFRLEKRIPSEAGLAGGSADAAATLRGLNKRFGFPLSEEAVLAVGLKVGADVPFCLTGGTRLVSGIGDEMRPLPSLTAGHMVLIKPSVGSNTAEAYRRADLIALPHPSAAPVMAALETQDVPAIARAMGNSFEAVIDLPEIARWKARLMALGADGACMTGSGTAICGLFADAQTAQNAYAQLQRESVRVFLCSPVSDGWAEN